MVVAVPAAVILVQPDAPVSFAAGEPQRLLGFKDRLPFLIATHGSDVDAPRGLVIAIDSELDRSRRASVGGPVVEVDLQRTHRLLDVGSRRSPLRLRLVRGRVEVRGFDQELAERAGAVEGAAGAVVGKAGVVEQFETEGGYVAQIVRRAEPLREGRRRVAAGQQRSVRQHFVALRLVAFLVEIVQDDPIRLIVLHGILPRRHALLPVGHAMLEILLDVAHLLVEFRELHLLRRGVNDRTRLVVVVQEGEELVILVLLERIVFVVVALRALDGEAEHAFAEGVHAVEHRLHAELLGVNRALHVHHGIAQVAGGDDLILRGVRQHVAGELFEDELVVGQVLVEGVDHVIAIRPHLARHVLLVTITIRIARGVEPVASPTFPVVRRGEQLLDDLFVGVTSLVGEECIDFGDGRRQAGEVEMQAAEQGDAIRFGRGLELFGVELREDEIVHRRARPVFVGSGGSLRPHRRLERPMILRVLLARGYRALRPHCALIDPCAHQADLFGGQTIALLRHLQVGMRVCDSLHQDALGALARLQHLRAKFVAALQRVGLGVQAHAGLLLLWAVAGEATVREQRLDVLCEIHRARGGWRELREVSDSGGGRGEDEAAMADQEQ